MGSYHTAWQWLHKLRRVMGPSLSRLAGTVVIDETKWGSGTRAAGRSASALIMIAAEVDGKCVDRIRLCVLPDDSAVSIEKAVISLVDRGALVQTDKLRQYSSLQLRGYQHHAIGATAVLGERTLPEVAPVVDQLKAMLLNTHCGGMRNSHLPYYLDEFSFRFNHRKMHSHRRRFQRLLTQAVQHPPMDIP